MVVTPTPGARPSRCCVVSECSQLSRSGPVTAMTPRWDRSTTPCPAASSRCSRMGSPKCQGTPASIPSSARTRPDCEAELMSTPAPTPEVFFPGNCHGGTMRSPYSAPPRDNAPPRAKCRSHPSEAGPHMRLERLAGCRLVKGPEQIPLDIAVEPLSGRVVLGRSRADHRICGQLDFGPGDSAVPDLGVTARVAHDHLQRPVRLRPPETGLHAQRPNRVAVIVPLEDLGEIVQVVLPVVGEVDLLPELEVLGSRIAGLAGALPTT